MSRDIAARQRGQKKDWLDRCFERVKSLQSTHGQRIDWLKSEGDNAYRQMDDAFERSKSCFSLGDHGGAGSWAAQGRQHKARLQEVNAEKGRLIDTMKAAQGEFATARDDYRKVKAEHEHTKEKFQERLEYLKTQSAKERAAQQAAREAKSKQRQRDQAERERATRERTRSRELEARRQDARRTQERARQRPERLADISRFKRDAVVKAKRELQYKDEDVKVEVRSGHDRDYNAYVTEIFVFHRDPAITQHLHVVIDEHGNELMNRYRADQRRR